jgi:hypothetical protein
MAVVLYGLATDLGASSETVQTDALVGADVIGIGVLLTTVLRG